ncbi:haloperoxidase [Azospirillum sp. TSH7]|nr:haloperoxidase [Azospirillum sp. TSH20]PWC59077.1 haloperoxidase [Azospirillum sp. TSH7]
MRPEDSTSAADATRRSFIVGTVGTAIAGAAVATAASPATAVAAERQTAGNGSVHHREGKRTMTNGKTEDGFVTAKDGASIYYKDWGPRDAQTVMFHHGWPLTADDWDAQMLFFLNHGYRVVAHDRRGHGRSTQTATGNEMDTYADDVLAVVAGLGLKNVFHVGHSTGGGEVARYLGRHGTSRAGKAALLGAVPPIMVKTEANPGGLPLEVFDGFRTALAANRAQFFREIPSGPFYGFNRDGAQVSQGVIDNWWRQGMMGGTKAHYDCIKAFSETDFTEDLKKIDIPVLVMHGDDDQIVPITDSALLSSKLLPKGTLKVYKGFPHGMATTHAETINADLLAFFKA